MSGVGRALLFCYQVISSGCYIFDSMIWVALRARLFLGWECAMFSIYYDIVFVVLMVCKLTLLSMSLALQKTITHLESPKAFTA